MGLFNHLFKNKFPQGDEKMEEGRQTPPSDGAAEPPAESKPDLTVFLHPKAYVPRGGAAPVHPGSRVGGQSARPAERKTPLPAPPSGGEIVLTLGDVLSRIPTQLLKTGAHDPKRVLRFKIGDLSSDIARGRAAVPLSRIAALCPDIFQKEVAAEEDMDVRLPLQKLVEQIGLMRSNPAAPLPGKPPRPVSSEAPPTLLPTRLPLAMRTPAKAPQSKAESKPPATAMPEPKSRAASAPFTPPVISEALRENILKAQPGPLRRNPASKAGNIVPFPSIAAKAETGPPNADDPHEEHPGHVAERAPEENLENLVLPKEAREESVAKPALAAQLHVVTPPAEIVPQPSLLKTVEADEAKTAGVSLAQPAPLEAPREDLAKSQLVSLLRMKLHSAAKPAAFTPESVPFPVSHAAEPAREFSIESKGRVPLPAEISAVPGAIPEILPAPPELKPLEGRLAAAEILEEKGREPALPPPLEKSVPKRDVAPVPRARIDHKKSAPEEGRPKESSAGVAQAVPGELKDLTPSETPIRVADASVPAEILHAETPKTEKSKKPEITAAEVLEDTLKSAAPARRAEEIVSSVESISSLKSEIIQTELAPKETALHRTEIKAAGTGEATPAELAESKPPAEPVLTEATAALSTELPPAETASGEHHSVDAATLSSSETTSAEHRPVDAAAHPATLPSAKTTSAGHRSVDAATLSSSETTSAEHRPVDAAAHPATLPAAETASVEHRPVDAAPPPAALPPPETASKNVESGKVDASAMEVSEVAIKAAAAAALLKQFVSRTESISPPQVEIAASEHAPTETETKPPQLAAMLEEARQEFANKAAASNLAPEETEARDLQAVAPVAPLLEEVQKELSMPKPAAGGSKTETVVSAPVQMPRAEVQPPKPDLKKSEMIPPAALADSPREPALPELSHLSAPKLEAPPKIQIAHAEIASQEQEPAKPEPVAIATQEHAQTESLNGRIAQSEPALSLALEPVQSEIAPHEATQVAPEAGTPVAMAPQPTALAARASVPDAPLEEPITIAAIPASNEIESKDALEPAVLAEAQSAKPPRDSKPPIVDAPAVTSHQEDESISALLVSLAALTESSPEGSDDSPQETDEESAAQDAGKIRLKLSPILKNCPKEILAGTLPRMRRNLGIDLPLAQIEPQLASGAVAISSLRFISALPPEYMQHFVVKEDVKVPIPIEEILRNLPGLDRERIAQSFDLPLDATAEQIRKKIAQPAAEPPRIVPIPPAPPSQEAKPIVPAAAEMPSESVAPSPQFPESVLEPALLEVGESAIQPEPITAEPEASVPALAEPPAPEVVPELPPAPALAPGETSSAEPPSAIAHLQEPTDVADATLAEEAAAPTESESIEFTEFTESTESTESTPPAPEPPKPFALHIPTFRVFAPPPLNVSPSIASAPATPVPLAWAGHVSTQPPLRSEPAPTVSEPPIPSAHSQPRQDAPPSDLQAPPVPDLPPPNADTAADQLPRPSSVAPVSPPPATQTPAQAPDSLDAITSHTPSVEPPSPPIESAAEQPVLPVAPEPRNPDASQAAPIEPAALIRPPMVRPMMISPPPILAFTPALESPLPEKPFPAASPAPADRPQSPIPHAPIPPAFAPAAAPSAEIRPKPAQPETKAPAPQAPAPKVAPVPRAPDQSNPESAPKATPPVLSKPGGAVPKIPADPAAEKPSVPKPPKIALSVPKPPPLRVPAAPTTLTASTASTASTAPAPEPPSHPAESVPPPPPLPLARFDQDVLQTLFMTDEFLDLPAICQRVSTLPGIQACVISRRGENVQAGELPQGFELPELLALAPGVTQIAGRLPIGSLKHFTLFAETHSVSFFERHGVHLCVVHRTRSFIPGVREKLVTVADELSKL